MAALAKEGATGAVLAGRLREEAREAARRLPDGARPPSSTARIDELVPLLEPGDTLIDGGNSHYHDDIAPREAAGGAGPPLRRHGHQRRRLGPGARLLPDDRRRGRRSCSASIRSSPRWRPGRGEIPRTPGREKLGGTAEQGYLHCGPSGAGHFVKMIHNGIEYGLMAAYAEGLNILKKANIGKAEPRGGRRDDAAAQPRALPVRLQPGRHHRGVAARQRRRLLAARPDRARRSLDSPDLENFAGKVSDSGEGRWTVAAANDEAVPAHVLTRGAVRALRLARRGRLPEQGAVRHALRLRRPRGEEVSGDRPRLRRAGLLRRHRRPRLQEDLPRPAGAGRGAASSTSRSSAWPSPAGPASSSSSARAGQRDRARRPRRGGLRQAGRAAPLRGRRLQRPGHLRQAARRSCEDAQRPAHYLAIPPSMFPVVVENLAKARLHRRTRASSWRSRSAATWRPPAR